MSLGSLTKVEVTVVQKFNQTSYPENVPYPFSGGFFGYFFPQKK
jgi:hypothetical protein